MNFPIFIAHRFFRNIGADKKRASNPTITIATAGVAVGLAVMIITLCVIMGFKREIISKVNGFASDIEVLDYRSLSSPESFPITADRRFVEEIRKTEGVLRVDRIGQKMGILKTDTDFQGVTLKGIPADYDTTFIASTIIDGRMPQLNSKDGAHATGSNEILISQHQAEELHLKVGDRVFAYFFEQNIKMRRFKVCGIYCTNMGIFDKTFVVTDLNTIVPLNSWTEDQCSSLEVRLRDPSYYEKALVGITTYCAKNPDPTAVPRRVLGVREHYAQVFSWLSLLDFNMVVILVLMLCVAGFTMISGLLILILERTQTIGVLKALGATNTKVRKVFLYFAMFITARGLFYGNIIALLVLFAQGQWGLIHLDPSSYYVDTVPLEINVIYIVLLNIGTLLLTTLALVAPSFMITHIQPAKAIRYE